MCDTSDIDQLPEQSVLAASDSCKGGEKSAVQADQASDIIIIIIGRAKRAPHWGVQSRFRVIYIYIYICACVCRGPKSVGGITCAHAQSQYWAVKSDQ